MATLARSDPGGGHATRSYSWDESYLHHRNSGNDPYSYHHDAGGLVSTSSSSASPPDYLQQHPSYRMPTSPVVLRTNFGKDSSYRPPPPSSAQGSSYTLSRDRSGRSQASEETTPFDQRGDTLRRRRSASAGSTASSGANRRAHHAVATASSSSYSHRHRRQPSESSASAVDRPFDEGRGSIRSVELPGGAQAQQPHQPPAIRRVLGAGRIRRGALEGDEEVGASEQRQLRDLRNPEDEWSDSRRGGTAPNSSTIGPRFRGYLPPMPSDPSVGEEGGNVDVADEDEHSPQRRYRMAPPRISDPVLLPYLTAVSPVARTEEAPMTPSSLAPGSNSNSAGKNRISSGSSSKHHQQQQSRRRSAGGAGGREPPEDDDNDSIFDFEEENPLRGGIAASAKGGKTKKSRPSANPSSDSRRLYPMAYVSTTEEDDEDEEYADPYGIHHSSSPLTLTERAQAAWKRKEAQRSRSTSPRGKSSSRSLRQDEGGASAPGSANSFANATASGAVRFSQNDDTIHHFEPDPDPDETLDSLTFGGRSLNSEYTKSAESEVEDFIKDILMIGSGKGSNPGRRKVKYSPNVQRKLQQRKNKAAAMDDDADPEEEDATYESNEDDDLCSPSEVVVEGRSSASSRSRHQHQPRSKQQEPSVFCTAADDSVDGSRARGSSKERKSKNGNDPLSSVWNYLEGGFSAVSSALGFDDGSQMTPQRSRSSARRSATSSQYSPGDTTGDSVTTEGLFDPMMGEGDVYTGQGRDRGNLETAPSLEEDVRLVDLALQAARSMHKLRGFEYDETNEINIASDIRFSVVDLSLPLGLIFQENETGCWVTKVLPDGSAAKCQYIEVGDQLAAIDGVSAIKMSVEDIAALIRRKSSDIELTFLRYVGPWRPAEGTVAEEGYEVRMQTRREKPINLPGCGLGSSSINNSNTVVSSATNVTPPAKPQSSRNLRSSVSGAKSQSLRPLTPSRRSLAQSRSLSPTPRRAMTKQNSSSRYNAASAQSQGKNRLGFWRFGKKK